jgi:hypothetical protein
MGFLRIWHGRLLQIVGAFVYGGNIDQLTEQRWESIWPGGFKLGIQVGTTSTESPTSDRAAHQGVSKKRSSYASGQVKITSCSAQSVVQ